MTLRWSKTPPSTPGWYWWKPSHVTTGMETFYPVVQRWDEAICVKKTDPEDKYGWFAGPIEPPEENAR